MDKDILKQYIDACEAVKETEEQIRQLQKKMNGCIASRADLRKNLPMSRKIDHMIVRYLNLV